MKAGFRKELPWLNSGSTGATDSSGNPVTVPADRLGEIRVENGTFAWIDHGTEMEEKVTAINGTVSWPRLNSGIRADIRGIFRGEAAALQLSSDDPLLLLSGKNAQANINLAAAPLDLTFDGMVNLSEKPFLCRHAVDGQPLHAPDPAMGRHGDQTG